MNASFHKPHARKNLNLPSIIHRGTGEGGGPGRGDDLESQCLQSLSHFFEVVMDLKLG